MYRYSNGQISLSDFKQPVGMNLKENNRWVKKAQTIPWPEIEKRYAALFTNRKGNVAKPLRLALGACIIQAEYGYSDEETALQSQENPYLQYFCGYPGYDDEKLPFDAHSLKALIAPRVFFDSQALSDIWAGPVNTYQTSIAAREVWKLYGKPENVLWYWRSGSHAHLPEDFDMLIEIIERERHGTPLCDKFQKLPFDPPEPIYDWSCPAEK